MPNPDYLAYFTHMYRKNKYSINKRRFLTRDKKMTNTMYNRNEHSMKDNVFNCKISLNYEFREKLYKPGENRRIIHPKYIIRNNGNTLIVKRYSVKI